MKKSLLFISCVLVSFIASVSHAQNSITRCYTDEYNNQLRQDPAVKASMDKALNDDMDWLARNGNTFRTTGTTIIIPVVVHIIWSTAAQNLSYDIIKSQIDVLNEDFGGYNSDITKTPPFFRDRRAMDTGIRFQLATRDPSGNPTNGIVRVFDTTPSNTSSPAWPASSYLNMWVYNLGGGLLGFAQFPGGPPATDGVNILYSACGRISPIGAYNYGRTATHEIGHWINLRHIWGDANCGNDQVLDTPTQSGSNFGCPSCHGFTCSNQPTGDMYMNYMDYVDDKCMYLFSQGQADRMWATLNGTRVLLQTSLGLTVITSPALDAGITEIITPGMIPCQNTDVTFIPEVVIKNFGTTPLTSAVINYRVDAGTTNTYNWAGLLAVGLEANVTLPSVTVTTSAVGDHIFYCYTSAPNGGVDLDTSNNRTSRNFIGHALNTPFPLTEGFEATVPPASWSNRNYDCGTGWAKSTTASHSGTGSAYFNNFTATATLNGVMDELTTRPVDMTLAPANASLKFWVAYAPKSATGFDTLEVFVSTDCGETFTSVYKKWNTTLATAAATASAFIPTSSQWREETVSLTPYIGVKNLVFVFRNTNHGGNNLYIDDVNVSPTAIQEILAGVSINIYPNPSEGLINISTSFENAEQMQIFVTNALGQQVYTTTPKTTSGELTTIDLSSAAKGIYFVELRTGKGSLVKKVSLSY